MIQGAGIAIAIFCTLLVSFLAFTERGNLTLAYEIQASFPAESATGMLTDFAKLIQCQGKVHTLDALVEASTKNNLFRSWPPAAQEKLIINFVDLYGSAHREQERFALTLRLLDQLLYSLAPGNQHFGNEDKEMIEKICRQLLSSNLDKKEWSQLWLLLEKHRYDIGGVRTETFWPSLLRLKSSTLRKNTLTEEALDRLARDYLYSVSLACKLDLSDIGESLAKEECKLDEEHHFYEDEVRLHICLGEYFLSKGKLDRAREEGKLAKALEAKHELVLTPADEVHLNRLAGKRR